MKTCTFILASALLLLSLSLKAQEDPYVKSVNDTVQKIDKYNPLTSVAADYPPESPGQSSIQLTGYFKGDLLCKIICHVIYNWGIVEYEFYFSNEQLLYVHETERHLQFDYELKSYSGELNVAYVGRYYFNSMQIVHEDNMGKKTESYKKGAGPVLVKNVQKYMTLLKAKKGN